jgi:hypothetical protein
VQDLLDKKGEGDAIFIKQKVASSSAFFRLKNPALFPFVSMLTFRVKAGKEDLIALRLPWSRARKSMRILAAPAPQHWFD